jgi:phospholipid/cholesterol/gamma-HCH transport system substrate-binding protein
MKNERKTEIRVGMIVIVALLLFIWIFGWAKNFRFTSSDRVVHVKFENVAGLEIGDLVTVNGVRKGNVESFDIVENDVIVKLDISGDVNLRSDAQFGIIMLDLMGGKRVEILPGTSATPLDYNIIHEGTFYADIPSVISMLGSVQEDIVASLKDMRITLSSVNEYLTDRELQENIKSSIASLNEAAVKLNIMIDENRTNLDQLIDNSSELTGNLNSLVNENRDNLTSSINNIQTVIKQTDSLLASLNFIAAETRNKENNLGRLLYEDEYFTKMNDALNNVNKLMDILINQLEKRGVKVDLNIF